MNDEQHTPPPGCVDAEQVTYGLPATLTGLPEPVTKPPITAAQAKVEAIADLTHSAYQKAGTLNLTKEESEQLQADFPDEAFKPGAAGKENLIYIEHAFLRDRFIKVFGMGGWALIPRSRWAEPFITAKGVEGSRVYVEAMLVVRGVFVAESVGEMEYYPKNAAQNYGDAVEGATTAAFRRCAKNFGVGLQAWKKDWCDGWWGRKRAPHTTAARGQPRPLATHAAKPVEQPLKGATEKTKEWFLNSFEPEEREMATQFCMELGWIMPNEGMNDLPLRFIPVSKQQLASFRECLGLWVKDGKINNPYLPNAYDEEPDVPLKTTEVAGVSDEEMWYDIIVPIPRKGMKRDEYLKNPDTIGSLFDARHEDENARKRLWGLMKGGEECGWVPKPREYNGKIYQPSDADKVFYQSLKQFKDWFDANHEEGDKL
jgi:hypothetical protein